MSAPFSGRIQSQKTRTTSELAGSLLTWADEGDDRDAPVRPRPPAPRRSTEIRSAKAVIPVAVDGSLRAAFDLAARPTLARAMNRRPLPRGIIVLIRIAAGCADTLRRSASATRRDPVFVREAASIYLQEVLWTGETDHYRALGVHPNARPKEIAEHLLWFAKWVATEWGWRELEDNFSERVLPAWNALKTPERRQQYDEVRLGEPSRPRALPNKRRPVAAPPPAGRRRPSRARRQWLQVAATVAATLAVIAITAIDWIILHPPVDTGAGKVTTVSSSRTPPVDG